MSLFTLASKAFGQVASANLSISRNVSTRSFQRRCYAFLRSSGWTLVEDIQGQPILRHGNTVARVFFLGPGELCSVGLQRDFDEARRHTTSPLGLVIYEAHDDETRRYCKDRKIALCHYTELDLLKERCDWAALQPRNYCGREFVGVVDGFDLPSTIRGWVKLLGTSGLIGGLTLFVFNRGKLIGTTQPDHPRPDITGSKTIMSGFKIDCGSLLRPEDFAMDRVLVRAKDAEGYEYDLTNWDKIMREIGHQTGIFDDRAIQGTLIGRLVNSTK